MACIRRAPSSKSEYSSATLLLTNITFSLIFVAQELEYCNSRLPQIQPLRWIFACLKLLDFSKLKLQFYRPCKDLIILKFILRHRNVQKAYMEEIAQFYKHCAAQRVCSKNSIMSFWWLFQRITKLVVSKTIIIPHGRLLRKTRATSRQPRIPVSCENRFNT